MGEIDSKPPQQGSGEAMDHGMEDLSSSLVFAMDQLCDLGQSIYSFQALGPHRLNGNKANDNEAEGEDGP